MDDVQLEEKCKLILKKAISSDLEFLKFMLKIAKARILIATEEESKA